ncbi:hypothetical protein SNEBB_000370 [Seison nebaliae]|nr:hypothetical protein SNEBB_000370 [Seison nebaliae]
MASMAKNNFEIPNWAGQPPSGLHMDVMKESKLIQKLMIDEKNHYYFGRNQSLNDFSIDHTSCSRVHAVLVWHRHLECCFLIDLGSTHGTFIGTHRLESNVPQQLEFGREFQFGASTRQYIVRERPNIGGNTNADSTTINDDLCSRTNDTSQEIHPTLKMDEDELQNVTEFNTAHNRRLTQFIDVLTSSTNNSQKTAISLSKGNSGSVTTTLNKKKNRKRKNVHFHEEEAVINLNEVTPNMGKFGCLANVTMIESSKKVRLSEPEPQSLNPQDKLDDDNFSSQSNGQTNNKISSHHQIANCLGLPIPNLTPSINKNEQLPTIVQPDSAINSLSRPFDNFQQFDLETLDGVHREKKKYQKETWPKMKEQSFDTQFQ